jgi:hypothetical protein
MSQSVPPFPPAMQPMEYGLTPPPRRGNGAAIASLVLGLLGCIPVLTSLLAVILGAVGIRKTRDPAVGGKGLAIAGLVLGLVGLLGWSVTGAVVGYAYVESKKAAPVAEQFLRDVSTGNVNAAVANSAGMTSGQLQTNSDQMSQFGTLQTVNFTSSQITFNSLELGGIVTFSTGQKTCTFTLVKQGGVYKVAAYQVQ